MKCQQMKNKRISLITWILLSLLPLYSQSAPERPPLWGIAKITFLASDFSMVRDYYGKFLGFQEAFQYNTQIGPAISFKVNDRQFLEFIEDPHAKSKNRLVSVSLETENAEQMRLYLKTAGVKVPDRTSTDGAGNIVFLVSDRSGNPIEFIEIKETGLHKKSAGSFLSDQRISTRIHHVGLYTESMMDKDPFYTGVLQFETVLRFPEDKNTNPVIMYFGIPESTESIEHYSPSDSNFSHPCFVVQDMQETIYVLRERQTSQIVGKPMIGKGRRWILNMNNPDGTRVEFTESYTVK